MSGHRPCTACSFGDHAQWAWLPTLPLNCPCPVCLYTVTLLGGGGGGANSKHEFVYTCTVIIWLHSIILLHYSSIFKFTDKFINISYFWPSFTNRWIFYRKDSEFAIYILQVKIQTSWVNLSQWLLFGFLLNSITNNEKIMSKTMANYFLSHSTLWFWTRKSYN